jgi:DNA polymerase-3 subunit epsilon
VVCAPGPRETVTVPPAVSGARGTMGDMSGSQRKQFTPAFERPEDKRSGQLDLRSLGTRFSDAAFTVVDLETTGTLGARDEITEIGAVRVRARRVEEEFSTLVRPRRAVISPFVQNLTGISNSMVQNAPYLDAVLPEFLEFSRGSVFVAHNAPFDIGFLRRACRELDYPWPEPLVLDTVRLARQVVPRPEVRNHKLGTLAGFFGTEVSPSHRALDDAAATAEILYHLFDRYHAAGIDTLEELKALKPVGTGRRAEKRHLAHDVPARPGVYMFVDAADRVLYVGTSRNMHARVQQYFTVSETRGRMVEMIAAAVRVQTIVCDSIIEAQVREVRLIGELAPPYNRASKHPDRLTWVRLTAEAYPRLSLTRRDPGPDVTALGPFRSNRGAAGVKHLLERIYPLKTCTTRVPRGAEFHDFRGCPAGEIGGCAGPCAGDFDVADYTAGLADLIELGRGRPADFVGRLRVRLAELAGDQRYEAAATARDAGLRVLRSAAGNESRAQLEGLPEVLAAQPVAAGGFDVAILRYGRLAGSAHVDRLEQLEQAGRVLRLTGEYVSEQPGTLRAETGLLLDWLGNGETRFIMGDLSWTCPLQGAQAQAAAFTARPGQ